MPGILIALGLLLLAFGMMTGVTVLSPTPDRSAAELEADLVTGDTECYFCEERKRCLTVQNRSICSSCREKYF